MDIENLREKYKILLEENKKLKRENIKLKLTLKGLIEKSFNRNTKDKVKEIFNEEDVNNYSPPEKKINLFKNLFSGREDIFAKRWENKKGISGYSPVCLNEWNPDLCHKPSTKCSSCKNRKLKPLENEDIIRHLSGKQIIGVYPLLKDNTCHFLVMDFDKKDWLKDIKAIKKACIEKNIPVVIERSRSGNGGHIWFFFKEKIEASIARKFGTSILSHAMSIRHEIDFDSYDRLFPSQDILPNGGFGNLIALPLQKQSRKEGNSVFLNDNFEPFEDQWKYLSTVKRINNDEIAAFTKNINLKSEFGSLRDFYTDGNTVFAEQNIQIPLSVADFPTKIKIIRSNMIHIEKKVISNRVLNEIKRLAAFKNPEFYRAQTMRLPVYNIPRIINLSDETEQYLSIPRGCLEDLTTLLKSNNVNLDIEDRRNEGKMIDISFNGILKEDQKNCFNEIKKYETGVLTAPPGFGKTIIALKLIAERKTNTLILVHTKHLLEQWKRRLESFLTIKNPCSSESDSQNKKKRKKQIGQLGSGKNSIQKIVDVALMQSMIRDGRVKNFIKDYGMIIVDECHHVPAFSFETIMKNCYAKYILGLTATPDRKDGHHPIIFMQCGPIRYKLNPLKQDESKNFDHYLIPKFTSFRLLERENDINHIYKEIITNKVRNKMIIEDIEKNYHAKRNILILTERINHVDLLYDKLKEKIPDIIKLTGKMSDKKKREEIQKISSFNSNENFAVIATGKLIGEGFDEPKLDTLFLAMPIAWKGRVTQYVGRIQRTAKNKKEVLIYDYADINIPILDRMYQKRLKTYKKLGYSLKIENKERDHSFIYENKNFFSAYFDDISRAKERIIIVSPVISLKKISTFLTKIKNIINQNVKVTIITKPKEELNKNQKITVSEKEKIIKTHNFNIIYKKGINNKFSLIDQNVIWYGSLNILGYNSGEEIAIRFENDEIANEFIKLI